LPALNLPADWTGPAVVPGAGRRGLGLNSDIGFPNYANFFGLQYLERNKYNFDEVGLKMDRLLIPKEKDIFAFLNFGIEV
jgi:hypothetical protein